MSDQPQLLYTQLAFRELLQAIGFQLGHGFEFETWCDTDTIENNFWVHFQPGRETDFAEPADCHGQPCNVYVNPEDTHVDAAAFLRRWRWSCVWAVAESTHAAYEDRGRARRG